MKRYFNKSISQSYITVIDLETTGVDTRNGSPILTYGLVSFKLGEILDEENPDRLFLQYFYNGIKPNEFRLLGIKGDIATHDWYESKVNAKVYEQNFSVAKNGKTLKDALLDIKVVIETLNILAEAEETNHYIFGNSPDFDQAMLNIYFDKLGITRPWKYWQNLDLRTLAMLYPSNDKYRFDLEERALKVYSKEMKECGYDKSLILPYPKHTAIYDATLEALQLIDILKKVEK
nr:MAG TPA: DEDDh [Caudoviricetes sp.]